MGSVTQIYRIFVTAAHSALGHTRLWRMMSEVPGSALLTADALTTRCIGTALMSYCLVHPQCSCMLHPQCSCLLHPQWCCDLLDI